ncbi:MAG: SufE family protein [Alphaproteobacteria bacterium]|nr:SufE family protein [Alphaproteobacteria bacterium]
MNYAEIKTILSEISDPVDRLEFVMDLGNSLPKIPAGAKATEIKGCASRVEIYKDKNNNYYGAADAGLVRGILAIVLSFAQGKSATDIVAMNLSAEFARLNLQLGAGRMNGVAGIIEFLSNQ